MKTHFALFLAFLFTGCGDQATQRSDTPENTETEMPNTNSTQNEYNLSRDFDVEWKAALAYDDEGDYENEILVYENLLEKNISDLDKSVIWVNIALTRETMNDADAAIQAYDNAISIEQSTNGYWATFQKGAYLAEKKLFTESITTFERLLEKDNLSNEVKDAAISNLQALKNR